MYPWSKQIREFEGRKGWTYERRIIPDLLKLGYEIPTDKPSDEDKAVLDALLREFEEPEHGRWLFLVCEDRERLRMLARLFPPSFALTHMMRVHNVTAEVMAEVCKVFSIDHISCLPLGYHSLERAALIWFQDVIAFGKFSINNISRSLSLFESWAASHRSLIMTHVPETPWSENHWSTVKQKLVEIYGVPVMDMISRKAEIMVIPCSPRPNPKAKKLVIR